MFIMLLRVDSYTTHRLFADIAITSLPKTIRCALASNRSDVDCKSCSGNDMGRQHFDIILF